MDVIKLAIGWLSRRLCLLSVSAVVILAGVGRSRAQPLSIVDTATPQRARAQLELYLSYPTRLILLHTDLPVDEARAVLKRLEYTLRTVSKYWGRKSADRIECYVVDKLENWRASDFPHACARTMIGGVGGGAFAELRRDRLPSTMKVTVYSNSQTGVVEHELVHAYCGQTFGTTGPDWYKEGMAEMPVQSSHGDRSVQCRQEVIRYLQKGPVPTVQSIVSSGKLNLKLRESLEGMQADSTALTNEEESERLQQWVRSHAAYVRSARDYYRWCWTLCHFLTQNPNYSKRFQWLGRSYLSRRPETFPRLFGSMQNELDFEYRFFLDRIDIGYRVDLCRWDWSHSFRDLDVRRIASARIKAAYGYQASDVRVVRSRQYLYETVGTWQTEENGPHKTADGDRQQSGRLVGVVMSDYQLSEPFDLGKRGSFVAPRDGELYLRCQDKWNALGNNRGSVLVQLRVQPTSPPGKDE